jgi:hypothetical protein
VSNLAPPSQVQDAFEQLFALVPAQPAAAARLPGPQAPPPGCAAADADAFLRSAAAAVLRMPPWRKGRYAPLLSLLPRVGAGWMVAAEPQLVSQIVSAMSNDMAASSATAFFKGLLMQLRAEAGASADDGGGVSGTACDGEDDSAPAWCAAWLPAVVDALAGDDERLRTYFSAHGLPVLLQTEPALLRVLLRALLRRRGGGHGGMAGAVVVLRAARQLQLFKDFEEVDALAGLGAADGTQAANSSNGNGSSSHGVGQQAGAAALVLGSVRELLLACIASGSEPLRLASLELVCVHPRCGRGLHVAAAHGDGRCRMGTAGAAWAADAARLRARALKRAPRVAHRARACMVAQQKLTLGCRLPHTLIPPGPPSHPARQS